MSLDISPAMEALLKAASSSRKLKPSEKEQLQTVKTTLKLLATLELCSKISLVIGDKIKGVSESDEKLKGLWQSARRALLSGVLDFLDECRTAKSKDMIADALFPDLCASLPLLDASTSATQAEINLLSTVKSAAGHPNNQKKLRSGSLLGGQRLGALISQTRDYLALESLLNLLATLLPLTNNNAAGRANRLTFIKSVFESGSPPHFTCGSELTSILQNVAARDWEVTAAKILGTLARCDFSWPQPFAVSHVTNDGCETFQALYAHVSNIRISASKENGTHRKHVVVHLDHPPLLGISVMKIANAQDIVLEFDIETDQASRLSQALKARRLTAKKEVKTSLCESTSLDFDLNGNRAHEPSAQEKIATIGRIFDAQSDLFNSEAPGIGLDVLVPVGGGIESPPVATVDPREICAAMSTPKKDNKGPLMIQNKSPLYESVFGSSDSELSDPDEYDAATSRRKGTVKQRARKTRKIVESDIESCTESVTIPRTTHPAQKSDRAPKLSPKKPAKPTVTKASTPKKALPTRRPASPKLSAALTALPTKKEQKSKKEPATPETTRSGYDISSPLKRTRPSDDVGDDEPEKKRQRGNPRGKVTPVRKQSTRTAAMLEVPKKPVPAAKRYCYKGRASSPIPDSSRSDLIDFDELPQSSITKVAERHVTKMKAKNGEKNKPAQVVTEKKPVVQSSKVVESKVVTKITQVKPEKTEVKKKAEKVIKQTKAPVPTKEAQAPSAIKKVVKPQKAPEQEQELGIPEKLPKVAKQESTLPTEPEILESSGDGSELFESTFVDVSLEIPSTSEDIECNHRIETPPPLMIDLTDDSPMRPSSDDANIGFVHEISLPLKAPLKEPMKSVAKEGIHRQAVKEPQESRPTNERHQEASREEPNVPRTLPSAGIKVTSRSEKAPVSEKPAVIPANSWVLEDSNARISPPLKSVKIASRYSPQEKFIGKKASPVAAPIQYHAKVYDAPIDEQFRKCDAMEAIVNVVVRRVCERFDGVTKEVREGRDLILHEASADLERMRIESVIHFNNVVGLEEEYCASRLNITARLEEVRKAGDRVEGRVREIIREHDRQSLTKKFPASLFARPGVSKTSMIT
ncbi:hypothetical protein ONZ45_g5281 [Pleurotus djamor]|nr:hypothetical protein ONZ45_g5281 [Pleurotus djamor]